MIEDGLPMAFVLPQAIRDRAWVGRKVKALRFAEERPKEDPEAKKLRREIEAAAKKKQAERFARLNEEKQLRAKQAHKPEGTDDMTKTATQQETAMSKTNTKKTSKADQVAARRTRRAAVKGPKAAGGKKAAKAKARTPAAAKAASDAPKAIRPGSKLEIVVGLLKRKEGCTTAEVLAACHWPAVSMPQQAKAAGLTLRQEKQGKVTRYWGS